MSENFVALLITLFLIINPIGLVPIFLVLTANTSNEHKKAMALKGVLVGMVILITFSYIGKALLETLGISVASFKTGGGILLLLTALQMVFEKRQARHKEAAVKLSTEKVEYQENPPDVSVFPIGTLFIAGPGSITTAILLMGQFGTTITGKALVTGAMLLVLGTTYITLVLANQLSSYIPETITNVISRILGILLVALAVQFIFDGLQQTFFQ